MNAIITNGLKRILPPSLILIMFVAMVGCDDPTEPEVPAEERLYSFLVKKSNNPLSNAKVSIPLETGTRTAKTNGDGRCSITIPNDVQLPSRVIATIDHSTIMPEAVTMNGGRDANSSVTRDCRGLPGHTYVRDINLHHLGNDKYDGAANSQHQLRTEGLQRSYSFHLDTYPNRMPMLRIFVRGVEHPTEVKLNGVTLNTLGESDGSGGLSRYTLRLNGTPTKYLKPGTNTLTIKTGATNYSNDPWDDIEFCGLILYYE